MKVLHLLAGGKIGGIEILFKDIMLKANFDNRICCLFEEGEIYRELKAKNQKIFSMRDKNKNFNKIVDALTEYCIAQKIDIITVHHGGLACNLIYIMLKKKLPKIKYVRYLHACFDEYSFGNDKGILHRILVKKVMKKAFECSDLLIFISKAVKKSFEIKFDIKNKNKVIIYNGIGEKFFEEKNLKNTTVSKVNIAFIGRLSYVKGVDYLIKAFDLVQKKYKKVYLNIIGDGEERKELCSLVHDLNLSGNVKFVGRQENVIDWLDNSDIFVYPSIWEEGFGISVVEAMARGCIPITFKRGALPEIIENNKNGILVDEINVEKLASAIEQIIIMNKDEKIKLINNAKNTARKFSINNTLDKLRNEYTNLINSNG